MFLLSKLLLVLGALVLQSQSHEMPQEEIELRPSSEISGTAPLDQHNSETALMDFIMNLPGLNKSQPDFPDRDTSRERANNYNYPVNIPVMKLNRTLRQLPIHPANMLFLQQQQQQQALAVAHLNQQLLNNNRNRFNNNNNNNNRNNQENTNYDDDSSEEDESGSDEYFSNNPIQRGVFPSGPGFRSDIPTDVDRLGESETSQDNPSHVSVKSNLTDSAELSPEFHSHNASHDDPNYNPSDSVSVKLDLSSDQVAGSIRTVPASAGASAHSSAERPSESDFRVYKPIEEKSYSAIFPIESANPSTVGDVTNPTENAGSDSAVPNYESEGRSSASFHNTRISESAASELEDSFDQAFRTTGSAKKPINPIVQRPEEDSPVKISDSQGSVSDDGYDLDGAATTGHSKVFKRASTLASEIGAEEGGSSSTPCNNLRNCWCGTPTTKMISVGAINVQTSLFPWLVSIHSSGSHLCTGNIISSNYILTAASCVHRIPANMILVTTSLTSRKPKTLRVEKIVNYSGRNKMPKENDLVLLKLHGTMTPGRHLKYACLPTNFTESKLQQQGMLVSFTHDFSTNKLTLLQTHVDQISSKKCHKMNSAPKNSTFCTLPRKKTCQANSGGSFVTRGKAYSFVMTGVNTGAPGCKKTGKATTYTRIEPYLEWIMKETLDSSFCKNRNTRDVCTLSRVLDSDLDDDDETLPE